MSELDKIKQYLNRHEVKYEIIALQEPLTRSHLELFDKININIEHVIVGSVMGRAGGACMVVVPATYLIDPASMALKLSSKFHEITESTFPNLPSISEFGFIPFPNLLGIEGIVEKVIADMPYTYIAIEDRDGDFLIKFTIDEFKKAIGPNARWESFGINTLELNYDGFDDTGKENKSLLGVERFTPMALGKRLKEKQAFPVMPATTEKILKLQSDQYADVEDLVVIVEQSPSLAAQVIKWSNSAYYGYPGTIKTIHDAIVKVLGFDMVMNMAMSLVFGKSFKVPLDGPIGLSSYWQHSIFTSAVIEMLTKKMQASERPSLGLAYLAGLLHNFGFLVLGELFPAHFNLINQLIPVNPHLTYLQVERCVLGVCHTHLGCWLMENWEMPEELISVTFNHHTTLDLVDEHQVYVALTATAVSLLARLNIGDGISPMIDHEMLEVLGLSTEHIEQVYGELTNKQEALQELSEMLAMA